jgi:isopentenyl phosphate kinase
MRRQLVLIKLGGSLITDKRKPFTINKGNVEFFTNEFADVRREFQETDFIIGTGAGSFGHFTAHKYGLRKGARTQEQIYGMCVTHNDVQKLSNMVAESLTMCNVPVFTMSPSSMLISDNGVITASCLDPVKKLLGRQVIPLLHGDMLCDNLRGASVLSTEELLLECVRAFRDTYRTILVVYLLDSDGVLDQNGIAIPKLGNESSFKLHGTLDHDVTGGMTGKIESARKTAQIADAVYLISGKQSGALKRVILGKNTGTRIIL